MKLSHARAIWSCPRPRPLHIQLFMRLRYCSGCQRTFRLDTRHKTQRFGKPTGKKFLHGVLYNGPFHPVCQGCLKNGKQKESYATDLRQRAAALEFAIRRRDKLKGYAGPSLSREQIYTVLSVGKCRYCGSTELLCVEHIQPMAKGGTHAPENLQCACATCNQAKGTLSEAEFLTWVRRIYAYLNVSAPET